MLEQDTDKMCLLGSGVQPAVYQEYMLNLSNPQDPVTAVDWRVASTKLCDCCMLVLQDLPEVALSLQLKGWSLVVH